MSRHLFTETMATGKARADARRSRGLATGKAAKGWIRLVQHHTPAAGTWERALGASLASWRNGRELAAEDYRRAVYPDRYSTSLWW